MRHAAVRRDPCDPNRDELSEALVSQAADTKRPACAGRHSVRVVPRPNALPAKQVGPRHSLSDPNRDELSEALVRRAVSHQQPASGGDTLFLGAAAQCPACRVATAKSRGTHALGRYPGARRAPTRPLLKRLLPE